VQAGLQVFLAMTGLICAFVLFICPHKHYPANEKDSLRGDRSSSLKSKHHSSNTGTIPKYLSAAGNSSSSLRASSRVQNRHYISRGNTNVAGAGDSSDQQIGGNTIDDRLRPMTPRRVKRRSARSIQSQKFGPSSSTHHAEERSVSRAGLVAGSSSSGRGSLRSNASRRSNHHRNSKKKSNHHFVSPINRLMQQQMDSETSHDEPHRRFHMRDQVMFHFSRSSLKHERVPHVLLYRFITKLLHVFFMGLYRVM